MPYSIIVAIILATFSIFNRVGCFQQPTYLTVTQKIAAMSKKSSAALSLSQNEVFDLVVEYLSTKGFSETAQTLKKEVSRKSPTASKERSAKHGSRLEDLLEKSYVTELASGDFLPR